MSTPTRSTASTLTLASSVMVVSMLPLFLAGALAVQITRDLGFGAAGLGGAVAVYRFAGTLSSAPLGRLTDRIGGTLAIRMATVAAALAALGIAVTATNLLTLSTWLALAGTAHALGQSAANRLIVNHVTPTRQGIALGVKQSAGPTASMLAGISVPLIAITVGWRWSFALAACLALAASGMTRRTPTQKTRSLVDRKQRTTRLPKLGFLVLLAGAFGLGTATSSTVTTFYVASAVAGGVSPGRAGTLFALASLAAIGTRLIAGLSCDQLASGHLRICTGLLLVGGCGVALLATGEPLWMNLGIPFALAGTWGFNGVFWFALVRAYPNSPGSITGAVLPGANLGAMGGPLVFGAVAEGAGYGVAWAAISVLTVFAAGIMLVADRKLTTQPRT